MNRVVISVCILILTITGALAIGLLVAVTDSWLLHIPANLLLGGLAAETDRYYSEN